MVGGAPHAARTLHVAAVQCAVYLLRSVEMARLLRPKYVAMCEYRFLWLSQPPCEPSPVSLFLLFIYCYCVVLDVVGCTTCCAHGLYMLLPGQLLWLCAMSPAPRPPLREYKCPSMYRPSTLYELLYITFHVGSGVTEVVC